jgi:hypothetical protein
MQRAAESAHARSPAAKRFDGLQRQTCEYIRRDAGVSTLERARVMNAPPIARPARFHRVARCRTSSTKGLYPIKRVSSET